MTTVCPEVTSELIVMMLQDFEIDLEGAQTLRILCYKKENESSILIGKGAFEVGLQLSSFDEILNARNS